MHRLASTVSSSHRATRRALSGKKGAKSMENNAKNQECAEHLGRSKADREALSDQDGAQSLDSSKCSGH